MMVSFAQFEPEMMKECQIKGIKKARAEGKYKGRAPKAMRQAEEAKALVSCEATRATGHVRGRLLSLFERSLTRSGRRYGPRIKRQRNN